MRIEDSTLVDTAPRLAKMETSVQSSFITGRRVMQPIQDIVDLSGEAMLLIKNEQELPLSPQGPLSSDVEQQPGKNPKD